MPMMGSREVIVVKEAQQMRGLDKLSREYADLEEVWKKEKSEALGAKSVRDEIDRTRCV